VTALLSQISIVRLIVASIASLAVAVAWAVPVAWNLFFFDDSYMYFRYVRNLKLGLGVAWNPDGVPTYGLTSQLWIYCILPFSFLPLDPKNALRLASSLAGFAALVLMGITGSRHARSPLLRPLPIALAAVAVPLLGMASFRLNLASGMDTMLSLLSNAALVFVVLNYAASPSRMASCVVGLMGFAAVLARPDNGLCALAVPFLVWATLPTSQRRADHLLGLIVIPAALIGANLLMCRWYFGMPLPLGFYAKSARGYEGFQSGENAALYLFEATPCALPFFAIILATLRRARLRPLAVFLLPVAGTFLYLMTVRQIMGFGGRFFIPFLPFLVVTALLQLDETITDKFGRILFVPLVFAALCALYTGLRPVSAELSAAYVRTVNPPPVPVPAFKTPAGGPLPRLGLGMVFPVLVDDVVAQMPPGASMAASEVGYLGVVLEHGTLIDLVGLNDRRIGIDGFSLDDLLLRAPDLIWLPHPDYTGLRSRMLSDHRFFDSYIVIPGAYDFGLAIRRGSSFRPKIEANVRAAWPKLYPSKMLDDYIVVP
jgi:hypothetical protein